MEYCFLKVDQVTAVVPKYLREVPNQKSIIGTERVGAYHVRHNYDAGVQPVTIMQPGPATQRLGITQTNDVK